jgi:hypothetical protein
MSKAGEKQAVNTDRSRSKLKVNLKINPCCTDLRIYILILRKVLFFHQVLQAVFPGCAALNMLELS